VLHAGGRPILKLPDRKKIPGVPSGWVAVIANDRPQVANFAKEFVNVVRTDRESEANVLAELIHGWFGPDAGRPGTRYEVAFEPVGDLLRMDPIAVRQSTPSAEAWHHYMREDIPLLFGLTFNPAIWNQGFIVADGHVFLLVTLEKKRPQQRPPIRRPLPVCGSFPMAKPE
jgi:hypothetical protein